MKPARSRANRPAADRAGAALPVRVALGITGGIAAYKSAEVVRSLTRAGCEVHVLMTAHAREFITPLTLQTLSGHRVLTDLWDLSLGADIQHIALARDLDLMLVAPATADILAKLAHGIADDFLTTFYLAVTSPVLVAPAMNLWMWDHPATRANVETLRARGAADRSGHGRPRLRRGGDRPDGRARRHRRRGARPDQKKSPRALEGRRVLVTAGPTREALDAARYLSNPSTGRMGYALASEALARGAEVTLISGPTFLAAPPGANLVRVTSADEMFRATLNQAQGADLILKAAAVADYRPEESTRRKVKKEALREAARRSGSGDRAVGLRLVPTPDILEEVGRRRKPGQILVGFAAETEDLERNARLKLTKKNLDLVIANRIGSKGEGFEAETNRALVLFRDGRKVDLPLMPKHEMAGAILDLVTPLLPRPRPAPRPRRAR